MELDNKQLDTASLTPPIFSSGSEFLEALIARLTETTRDLTNWRGRVLPPSSSALDSRLAELQKISKEIAQWLKTYSTSSSETSPKSLALKMQDICQSNIDICSQFRTALTTRPLLRSIPSETMVTIILAVVTIPMLFMVAGMGKSVGANSTSLVLYLGVIAGLVAYALMVQSQTSEFTWKFVVFESATSFTEQEREDLEGLKSIETTIKGMKARLATLSGFADITEAQRLVLAHLCHQLDSLSYEGGLSETRDRIWTALGSLNVLEKDYRAKKMLEQLQLHEAVKGDFSKFDPDAFLSAFYRLYRVSMSPSGPDKHGDTSIAGSKWNGVGGREMSDDEFSVWRDAMNAASGILSNWLKHAESELKRLNSDMAKATTVGQVEVIKQEQSHLHRQISRVKEVIDEFGSAWNQRQSIIARCEREEREALYERIEAVGQKREEEERFQKIVEENSLIGQMKKHPVLTGLAIAAIHERIRKK